MKQDSTNMSFDYPFGNYDGGNGNYILIKKDTGDIEKFTSGVSDGSFVVSSQINGKYKTILENFSINILFIFARPDDEQYVAGSIQQLIKSGHGVFVLYTTTGKNGIDVRGVYTSGSDELGAARMDEATSSLMSLGVDPLKIMTLSADDNSLDTETLYDGIVNLLFQENVYTNVIFTFDNIGVNNDDERQACNRISLEYYKKHDSIIGAYLLTVPNSDITLNGSDITTDVSGASHAVADTLVDYIYTLDSTQNNIKKNVIDIHQTQYTSATGESIKNHYTEQPYEYFSLAYDKLNNGIEHTNGDFIRMIFQST